MVNFEGNGLRRSAASFAARLVPLASEAVVSVSNKTLAFLPGVRVFIDPAEESLVSAILGDGPSNHWGEGEEPMTPVPERCAWEAMPDYDHLPARY